MANCANCSAPLPPDSIRCEYCGSRNDTDLKGVHYYTTHDIDTARTCPRCSVSLRTIDLKLDGRFLIERCDQCLGLFFDPGELEALMEATVTNVFAVDRGRLDRISVMRSAEYGVSYIKCPVCANLMNRVNFGTKSGVIVDRCREHGVWLDGGELRQLFEWMKAGGRILARERQEQQEKEAAEQERDRGRKPGQSGGEYQDFNEYGSILRHDDPDLFDVVVRAIKFFMK